MLLLNALMGVLNTKYSLGLTATANIISNNRKYTFKSNKIIIESLQANIGGQNYKFCQKVSWSARNNYAVAIGMNPAELASTSGTKKPKIHNYLDKTNRKITELLLAQDKYDGYYLLNIDPIIDPYYVKNKSSRSNFSLFTLEESIDILNKIINAKFFTIFDCVIFWGRSFSVSIEELVVVNKLNYHELFFTVNKSGLLSHPSHTTVQLQSKGIGTLLKPNHNYHVKIQ